MKSIIKKLILLLTFPMFFGCAGDQNEGWITILYPTTAETYTVQDTTTITLGGDVFVSPTGLYKTNCAWNPFGTCTDADYYWTHIRVNNFTTGEFWDLKQKSDKSTWTMSGIQLIPGENSIGVNASDEAEPFNWGDDSITIYVGSTMPPEVVSIEPTQLDVADINSVIIVHFSAVMAIDTISDTTFVVSDNSGSIAGAISFSANNSVATFTPSVPLSYNTVYTVYLDKSIQDMSGQSIAATTYSFKTKSSLSAVPTNLHQSSSGDGTVSLSWSMSQPVDYFNVYFYASKNGVITDGILVNSVTSTTYTHSGLTNGYIYYYVITAVISGLETSPSNITQAIAGRVINQFGTEFDDSANSVVIDTNGNIYVVGSSGINGGDVFLDPDGVDVFITKFNSQGSTLWSRSLATAYSDFGNSIAVDSSGNVYIAGTTTGDLGGSGNAGYSDVFIAKYSAGGVLIWLQQLGSSYSDQVRGIAVDSAGDVYITGSYQGSNVVAKYKTDGTFYWARTIGTGGAASYGNGIAIDADGNICVAGYTSGDITGSGTTQGIDVFVGLKNGLTGSDLWINQFGTSASDYVSDLTVDSSGNIYVVGSTGGDLAGTGYMGGSDVFVIKFDSSGNQIWVKQFGTALSDYIRGISVDIDDNIYLTGSTKGDLAGFGNAGGSDLFITKFDTAGNMVWVQQFGTSSDEYASSIDVDINGNIYLAGYTYGSLDGNNLGGGDAFVVHIYQ